MRKFSRFFCVLCLVLGGLAGPCYGEGSLAHFEETYGEVVLGEELRPDGKKALRAVFHVKADPDLVYRTLRDVERFPEFMPDSKRVKILEKGERHQIVAFSGSRGPLRADIVMKRVVDDRERRIEWSLVKGPPRELSGYWQVAGETRDGGVFVAYSNYMNAGQLIPDFLARSLLRSDIRAMVVNIRKRVESGGTWQSDAYRDGE